MRIGYKRGKEVQPETDLIIYMIDQPYNWSKFMKNPKLSKNLPEW